MTTTETYGCDRHGEDDAYQGCALCELESLRSRLADLEAEREHKLLDEAHILICQAIAAGNMGDDTPIQTRYAMRQWLEKFANSTADSASNREDERV